MIWEQHPGTCKSHLGNIQKWFGENPPKMTHITIIILPGLVQWGYPRWKMLGFYWTWDRHDVFLAYPEMEMVGSLLNLTKTPFKTGTGSVRGQVPYMKTRKTCWGVRISLEQSLRCFCFSGIYLQEHWQNTVFFLINLSTRYPLNILHVVIYDTLCSHISLI